EAEMVAAAGAPDVLLAYQPVGPKLARLLQLIQRFPQTTFSAIADNEETIRSISTAAAAFGAIIPVLLDIDCAMQRSGIPAGKEAAALYALLAQLPGVTPGGLHVYDGHISDADPAEREARCNAAFAPATALQAELIAA